MRLALAVTTMSWRVASDAVRAAEARAEWGTMADSPGDAKERVHFEGLRAYIIANAVGAIALLVFLQSIWLAVGAHSLRRFVLYGIATFATGIGIAMLGYIARYLALSRNQANAGLIHQIAHIWIPVLAIACFVAGAVLPVIGGLDSIGSSSQPQPPAQTVPGKKR